MDENPFQSPKSAPEVEKRPQDPPSPVGAFLKGWLLLTVLLILADTIAMLVPALPSIPILWGVLTVVAIVVLVVLALWIARRIP